MFRMRVKSIERQTEAIAEARAGQGPTSTPAKERRVSNDAFFSRIAEMQKKGGAVGGGKF